MAHAQEAQLTHNLSSFPPPFAMRCEGRRLLFDRMPSRCWGRALLPKAPRTVRRTVYRAISRWSAVVLREPNTPTNTPRGRTHTHVSPVSLLTLRPIGDMQALMAPEGPRVVATGSASSGIVDDAEPVVKKGFSHPYRSGRAKDSRCQAIPLPRRGRFESTRNLPPTGYAALHPWLQPAAPPGPKIFWCS